MVNEQEQLTIKNMKENNNPKSYRVRLVDTENSLFVVIDERTNFTFDEACDISIHELHKAQTERTERCVISIECADCGRNVRDIYVEPGMPSFCLIDNIDTDNVKMYVGKDFSLYDIFGVEGLSHYNGERIDIKYDGEEDQEPFVTIKLNDGKMEMHFRDGSEETINMNLYLSWDGAIPMVDYELLAGIVCDTVENRRK